nr:hypothetical protein [Sphingomonas sp. Y57]
MQIGTILCSCAAVQLILNALEGFEADKAIVIGFAEADVPFRIFHVTGIGGLCQNHADTIQRDMAAACLTKSRVIEYEASNIGLARKSARRITFKRFLHDTGHWLIENEHLGLAYGPQMSVAPGRTEYPVPIARPRLHAIEGLLFVLLLLVLRNTGEQVFDQPCIRAFAKLNRRRGQQATGTCNFRSQLQMGFKPARQTADIVNNDDKLVFPVLAEKRQHGFHAGPFDQASGHIVLEDLLDFEVVVLRIVAASRLLRIQTISMRGLLCRANAAVNNCLFSFRFFHVFMPLGLGSLFTPSKSRSTPSFSLEFCIVASCSMPRKWELARADRAWLTGSMPHDASAKVQRMECSARIFSSASSPDMPRPATHARYRSILSAEIVLNINPSTANAACPLRARGFKYAASNSYQGETFAFTCLYPRPCLNDALRLL